MLTNKKAVIFDMDGTLIDSSWVWKTVDDIYIEKYHIEKPDDFHSIMEGMSYTEVATYFRDAFHLPLTVEEIKAEWLEMTMDLYRDKVKLKEGVVEILQHLEQQGIKMGVATSSARELVEAVLKNRGIYHYFQSICTSCEVNAGKPAPDVYLKVAQELEIEPQFCLVFEDVPKGVQAGKNAGMTVSAIEDDSNIGQREQLQYLADYYIKNYFEVLHNTYTRS